MRIKFYLTPYNKPTKSNFHHLAICLAEGLKSLKIPFNGNIDYWFEPYSNEYLIKQFTDNKNSDINIYCDNFFEDYPNELGKVDYKCINILLDDSDGLFTRCHQKQYQNFNFILRPHYSQFINYPNNVIPWAFGLSNRMIRYIEKYQEAEEKKSKVLCNFRVSHNLRSNIHKRLTPIIENVYPIENYITDSLQYSDVKDINISKMDQLYWAQTGRRHNPEFYQTLNQYLFTYTFGGNLGLLPIEINFYNKFLRRKNLLYFKILEFLKKDYDELFFLYQFDSWRFWEALYSNTIPVHIDLESWGAMLPVMPVNKKHYLGINKLQVNQFSKEILSLPKQQLRQIAMDGKLWAFENYSPKAVAERLLKLIETI